MVGISGEGKPASKRRPRRRKKEVALNFYCSALAIARGPCQRAGGVLDHSPSRACRGERLSLLTATLLPPPPPPLSPRSQESIAAKKIKKNISSLKEEGGEEEGEAASGGDGLCCGAGMSGEKLYINHGEMEGGILQLYQGEAFAGAKRCRRRAGAPAARSGFAPCS